MHQLSDHKSSACPIFGKKLTYVKTRSYKANPFAKDVDMVAYKKLTACCEKYLPPHDPAVAWGSRFLRRVCHAALQARLPHEVFKLAVPLFNSHQLEFNVEGLVQQANAVASPSPPTRTKRKTSGSSSRSGDTSGNASRQGPSSSAVAKPSDLLAAPSTTAGNVSTKPQSIASTAKVVNRAVDLFEGDSDTDLISPRDKAPLVPESEASSLEQDSGSERVEDVEDGELNDDSDRSVAPSSDDNDSDDENLNEEELEVDCTYAANNTESEQQNLFPPCTPPRIQPVCMSNSPCYNAQVSPSYAISPSNGGTQNHLRLGDEADNNARQECLDANTHGSHSSSGTLNALQSLDLQAGSQGVNADSGVSHSIEDLGEGVFWGDDPVSEEKIPTRVLNEELAQLVFKQENIAQGRPEGWYLASRTARPLLFSTSLFHQRTAGDLILLTPTSTGARNLNFMSLFNSFREYIASESEKTKKLREHIYNQVLALFHGDSKGLFKDKLGWSKGPNNKQVKVSKIPEVATDLIEKKFSPPRRVVKPSIYFVGEEGTSEAAFLGTINLKQTFKIGAEATMFKGEFWDPKKRDEEALEASRSSLQREANSCLNVEGIIDIAETAASANQPEMSPVAKDLFLKVKALAMETLRLREPSLASAVNDFAAKKGSFGGKSSRA